MGFTGVEAATRDRALAACSAVIGEADALIAALLADCERLDRAASLQRLLTAVASPATAGRLLDTFLALSAAPPAGGSDDDGGDDDADEPRPAKRARVCVQAAAPWLAPPSAPAGADALSDEIRAFERWCSLSGDESAARDGVLRRVAALAASCADLGGGAGALTARPFGSHAAGLATFQSDVDVELRGAPAGASLRSLSRALQRCGWAARVDWRHRARVPVVCARCRLTGVDVDVSLAAGGAATTRALAAAASAHPHMFRPLLLVLKAALARAGLNKPFTGGLGSFKLAALLADYLDGEADALRGRRRRARQQQQQQQQAAGTEQPPPLGALLVGFLRRLEGLDWGAAAAPSLGGAEADLRSVFAAADISAWAGGAARALRGGGGGGGWPPQPPPASPPPSAPASAPPSRLCALLDGRALGRARGRARAAAAAALAAEAGGGAAQPRQPQPQLQPQPPQPLAAAAARFPASAAVAAAASLAAAGFPPPPFPAVVSELHVFDVDGTLLASPRPAEGRRVLAAWLQAAAAGGGGAGAGGGGAGAGGGGDDGGDPPGGFAAALAQPPRQWYAHPASLHPASGCGAGPAAGALRASAGRALAAAGGGGGGGGVLIATLSGRRALLAPHVLRALRRAGAPCAPHEAHFAPEPEPEAPAAAAAAAAAAGGGGAEGGKGGGFGATLALKLAALRGLLARHGAGLVSAHLWEDRVTHADAAEELLDAWADGVAAASGARRPRVAVHRAFWRSPAVANVLRSRGSLLGGIAAAAATHANFEARQAADRAKKGLRACGLPSFGKQEVTVLQFRVCGHCQTTRYFCPEHAKLHWRAHTREYEAEEGGEAGGGVDEGAPT